MAKVSKEQKSRITAGQAFNAAYRPGAKIKTEQRMAVRLNSNKQQNREQQNREHQQLMATKRKTAQAESATQKNNQMTRERMEKNRNALRTIQRAFEDATKRKRNAEKNMNRVR